MFFVCAFFVCAHAEKLVLNEDAYCTVRVEIEIRAVASKQCIRKIISTLSRENDVKTQKARVFKSIFKIRN